MKKISSVALTAALMVGFGGVTLAVPALAKKEEAPQGPTLSEKFRVPLLAAQTAYKAGDLVTTDARLAEAEAAASNDDERAIASSLRVPLEGRKAQVAPGGVTQGLIAALDAAIANPRLPADQLKTDISVRGQIAFNARQFQAALPLLTRSRDLGNTDPNLTLQIAQSRAALGDTTGAAKDMAAAVKAEEAAGRKAPEGWYRYIIARLYRAHDVDGALSWTRDLLAGYPTKENWRDAIISFGFQGVGAQRLADRNQLDLYRLMRATHSLGGQKEWLDYAAAALKAGLPAEAKSVIDEGRTAGAIPTADVDAARYYAQAKTSATGSKGGGTDAGGLLFASKDYAKAADKYRAALAGAADPDPLNLHLGMALALSGDKAGAQAAFAAVKSGANLDIARLWTTYVLTPPNA